MSKQNPTCFIRHFQIEPSAEDMAKVIEDLGLAIQVDVRTVDDQDLLATTHTNIDGPEPDDVEIDDDGEWGLFPKEVANDFIEFREIPVIVNDVQSASLKVDVSFMDDTDRCSVRVRAWDSDGNPVNYTPSGPGWIPEA